MPKAKKIKKRKPLVDIDSLRSEYDQKIPILHALLQEVHFILDDKLKEASIKTHDIEIRLKTFDSFLKKCLAKELSEPFKDIIDLAGARVICLFRSDMDKVERVVRDNFNVLTKDDKVSASADSFGYMSVHYECQIPTNYRGPRYDRIRDITFEIQVRTLCMHAWAAVSHYLDYKGEWDVPAHLRKELNALSGLFYVADSEFEQVYAASAASRERATVEIQKENVTPEEINLDTVSAYLRERFSDRSLAIGATSDLVQEIKSAGYNSLSDVGADIDRASEALPEYEKTLPPTTHLNTVGAARASLSIASESFRKARKLRPSDELRYKAFEKYLR